MKLLARLARAFRQGRIKSRRQLRGLFVRLWIFEWSRPAYFHPKACLCCGLLALVRAEPPPKCAPVAAVPDAFDHAEARRIEAQAASARHHDYGFATVERRVG